MENLKKGRTNPLENILVGRLVFYELAFERLTKPSEVVSSRPYPVYLSLAVTAQPLAVYATVAKSTSAAFSLAAFASAAAVASVVDLAAFRAS